MFLGQHRHTIDSKGRTSVPAAFRDLLPKEGARLIATLSDSAAEPRVILYTPESWNGIVEKLKARNPNEPGVKQILRTLVAFATVVEPDSMGRVLVPTELRERAALLKDVIWVGQLGHIELWSTTHWQTALDEALSAEHAANRDRIYAEL